MGETVINPLFSPEYVVLLASALAFGNAWLIWHTAERCRPSIRWSLAAMRALAVILFGVILLNPGKWRHESYGREMTWGLMLDRSASMATTDVNGKSRWSEVVRLAERIRRAAPNSHRLRIHTFSDDIEDLRKKDFGDCKPNGRATDIIRSCRSILSRYRSGNRQIVGLILLSDGRQVVPVPAGIDAGREFKAQEAPIYALPVGGTLARHDLSVVAGRRQYVGFKGQKLRVNATVQNEGLGPVSTPVVLADADGKPVAEQKVELDSGERARVLFDLLLDAPGHTEYAFRVPALEAENVAFNNEAAFNVAVLENRLRIFMAEGIPNWDSKFLVQLLRQQPTMQVTSVYRVSAGRFFKVETDISHVSESSSSVFPDTAAEIGARDMIILGKGSEYFLTPERIRLLRVFVRDSGGCVMFSRGKPYSSTFPDLEAFEPATWGGPLGMPFSFRPVSAHEFGLFGDMLPAAGDPIWLKLPQLRFANRINNLKAFSHVLAEGVVETGGKEMAIPLLVTRRYGKGMVLTVNAEGLWQWAFFPSAAETAKLYEEMWSQLVLWAAAYSEFLPGQNYSLRLSDNSVLPGSPVMVRIARRMAGTDVTPDPLVRISSPGMNPQDVTPTPIAGVEGQWTAAVPAEKPGLYRVELVDPIKREAVGPSAALEVRHPPVETDNFSADRELLDSLAVASGGRTITEGDILSIVSRLEADVANVESSRSVWTSVWNTAWLLASILALLAGEWFMRRRNGLL